MRTRIRLSLRRDPLAAVVGIAILCFALVGIGSALWGARVFHGADLMLSYAPYRDAAPENFVAARECVSDTVDNVLPASTEMRRRALDGEFADWNSYAGGGAPLASVPNFAALSPFSAPTYLLPPRLAPGYVKLLEVLLGATGMLLLLRRLQLTRSAALLGGLIFVSTGFMVTWSNWPQTRTASCIPWVFWAVERYVQHRTLRAAVPIAVAIAAMMFGGFPSVAGYTLYAVVPYFVVRTCLTSSRLAAAQRIATGLGFVGAGIALAGVQLLPFLAQISSLDLERAQSPNAKLPIASLVTMFAPQAYGHCGPGYFGPGNEIETGAFVGAAALVLIGVAIFRGAAPRVPRGITAYFVVATGAVIALGWVGHLPLELAQKLPVFSDNAIFRVRSVLGFFLAVLAAIGFDRLQRRPQANSQGRQRLEIGAMVMAACAALVLVLHNHRAYRVAVNYEFPDYTLAVVAALCTAAIVAWSLSRWGDKLSGNWSTCILGVIPILILVESASFARGFWPRIAPEHFYPTTPVHEFLNEHSNNGERHMATGLTMFPGTNVFYELATPNGHGFTNPSWMDLLKTVDRDVARTATFTAFGAGLDAERLATPILDRMAVQYVVTDPRVALYGAVIDQTTADDPLTLNSGSFLAAPIAGPLRGVTLTVESLGDIARPAWIRADILDAAGEVLTTNRRRVDAAFDQGAFTIAVAAEALDRAAVIARFSIEGSTGSITVAGDGPSPSLGLVRPEDDDLELVYAGAANIWSRRGALPRVRWASVARVVADDRDRLQWLEAANDANVVVLQEPQTPTDGLPAKVVGGSETGDERRITVDALGSGYVVVADALTDGWKATVDGKPAPLLRADHAMVAVRVEKGRHAVVLTYAPPKQRLGLLVTGMTACILLGVSVIGRRPREDPDSIVL